jgi:hypothetical protein
MAGSLDSCTGIADCLAVTAVTPRSDDGYGSLFQHRANLELLGRCNMQKDERDLLEVLKFELAFLKDGGYGRSPRAPWRPQYIFEDSLTCMNYDSKENPAPCSDCVLMHLVPLERQSEKIPCRHIPFNLDGETLESLYRYSNQNEIEETVEAWLQTTIRHLEAERLAAQQSHSKQHTPGSRTPKGTPLYQQQHPKCANPACPTSFHWTGGGKFFRFRPDPVPGSANNSNADEPQGIHGVRHYWLCECCSQVFTLVFEHDDGVVLKLLWPEISATQTHGKLSAA